MYGAFTYYLTQLLAERPAISRAALHQQLTDKLASLASDRQLDETAIQVPQLDSSIKSNDPSRWRELESRPVLSR